MLMRLIRLILVFEGGVMKFGVGVVVDGSGGFTTLMMGIEVD